MSVLNYFGFIKMTHVLWLCFMSFIIGILTGTLITNKESKDVQPKDKESDSSEKEHGEV